jgi:hypothetical protein
MSGRAVVGLIDAVLAGLRSGRRGIDDVAGHHGAVGPALIAVGAVAGAAAVVAAGPGRQVARIARAPFILVRLGQHGRAPGRAKENRHQRLPRFELLHADALADVPQPVDRVLLDVRHDEDRPRGVAVAGDPRRRQRLVDIMIVMDTESELFEVVGTLGAGRGLAHLLHGRNQ